MFNTKEKKERALGIKLFLKPQRCQSVKCVMVRRPHRPGLHGKSRRRGFSEYAEQLNEKQKFQFSYGLRESQMQKLFKRAMKSPAATGEMMLALLEQRLDNVVFRLGLAPSRGVGRQMVSHGHILVNGRKVTIPSIKVKPGDVISIRPSSKTNPIFKDLAENLKKFEPPAWLFLDQEKLEGKVVSVPKDFDDAFDINLVVDYYSKIVK